jgi:hypothetical protein
MGVGVGQGLGRLNLFSSPDSCIIKLLLISYHFLIDMLPNMFLFSSVDILLHLKNPSGTPHANWSLSQEVAQLLAETQKHGFGSLVSHLLGIFSTIKSLEQGTLEFW